MDVSFNLPASAATEVHFENAFNAPMSTAKPDSFGLSFFGSNGSLIEALTTGLFLEKLEVATLQSVSITQIDSGRVGDETQVLITVTTLNPIPAGGGLQLTMPKWNMMANPSLRDSFVIPPEEGGVVSRRLQATPSLCVPKLGVATAVHCVLLSSGNDEDTLTLLDGFPNGQPAGKTFSFFVNKIRNPLSMTEVPFKVLTFTAVASQSDDEISFAGLIDEATVSFKATAAASMDPKAAKITADVTTVQEFSTFYATFSFPVPIQAGCRLLIRLPDDFTLNAGDIALV